jgi:hypothetical protein
MKIYNNDSIIGMTDFTYILMYEFIQQTYPIWYTLLVFIIRNIIILYIKTFYISNKNTINLYDVILTINSIIIFSGRININYYNILFYNNNRIKINIIGNDKYVLINNYFYNLRKENNKYYSICSSNNYKFTVYFKPIIKYSQEECCICYSDMGKLIGLCGHQNVCSQCQLQLNKCPVCNDSSLLVHSLITI